MGGEATRARTGSWLALPELAPLQRDVVKIIAFVAMAGDHIATATGMTGSLLNVAGRCAFPLFALMAGCNLAGRIPLQASVSLLWLMALLAQPCYWLAFRDAGLQWWQLNILFTFATAFQLTLFIRQPSLASGTLAILSLAGYLPLSSASYGLPGLAMLMTAIAIRQVSLSRRPVAIAFWLAAVAWVNQHNGSTMMLSGLLLTLSVLHAVAACVPALPDRLPFSTWFCPAYSLHLLLTGMVIIFLPA